MSGVARTQPFGARLIAAVDIHGPLCVGIDPHPGLLAAWGLPDDAAGLRRFSLAALAALAGYVAVVKPQSAFFERHGSAGVTVLEEVLAAIRQTATLCLLDVKRGDIGSTMGGYADAYLRRGAPLSADAITLSPYLGLDALIPAVSVARDAGRGVFVLARTSNPEGGQVQLAERGGCSVAQHVADGAAALNDGVPPLGDVGLVVGATAEHGLRLDRLNGPVLAPGLGTQGATPADLTARFAGVDGLVLPTASRSVLQAGPDPIAVRAAAAALRDELDRARAAADRPSRRAR